MSWPLVKYVLTCAFRDRLIMALIVLLILSACLSMFIGSAALIEKDRFALVFAGSGLRLAGVSGLVLFVVFYIRRSFEAREIEFLLSRPVSRVQFLFSHAFAFSILALLVGIVQGICLYMAAPGLFGQGSLLWLASLVAENVIMACTALFFSMVLSSSPTAVMSAFALYVLARLMGQILGIIDAGSRLYDLRIPEFVMQGISALTPRLDLMGQTSWLVYGPDPAAGYGFVVVQGLVFTTLICLASLIDLLRRQF